MTSLLRDRKGRRHFFLKFECKSFKELQYRTVYAEDLKEAKMRLITKYSMQGIKKDTIEKVFQRPIVEAINRKIRKRPRVLKVQLVRSTNKQRNRGIVQEKQERMGELTALSGDNLIHY